MKRAAARVAPASMMTLAFDSYRLWADSLLVIGLRTSGFLAGRADSGSEALRMVTEKAQASAELAAKLALAGPLPVETIARMAVGHYGKRVSANRRRLVKRG